MEANSGPCNSLTFVKLAAPIARVRHDEPSLQRLFVANKKSEKSTEIDQTSLSVEGFF